MKWRQIIADGMLEIVFPSRCPACDEVLAPEERRSGYCKKCRKLIRMVGHNVCLRCGKAIASDREYCSDCLKHDHAFEQAKAVYEYAGPMKEAMYRFKYGNRRTYGRIFAEDAIHLYGRWLHSVKPAAIVPVPMFDRKKAIRGYNQAEEFAGYLSRYSGIPNVPELVCRVRDTPALKALGARERLISLHNAFRCTKVFRRNADILIVDDIFTTGATADAVAGALKAAGAGRIFCLFVCIGTGDNKGGSNHGSQKLQNM